MKKSQSQQLRNVFFRIYRWFTNDFKAVMTFDDYYETEMQKIINEKKDLI